MRWKRADAHYIEIIFLIKNKKVVSSGADGRSESVEGCELEQNFELSKLIFRICQKFALGADLALCLVCILSGSTGVRGEQSGAARWP